MYKVAHVVNRLLKHDLACTDQSHKPTAHQWEGILSSLECVLELQSVLSGLRMDPGPSQVALHKLQHELSDLPQSLVAGHLSRMDLDVSPLMR